MALSSPSPLPLPASDIQLADCRSSDPLAPILQQLWINFDDMATAISSFARDSGFIARHKVKVTDHHCSPTPSSSASSPSIPACLSLPSSSSSSSSSSSQSSWSSSPSSSPPSVPPHTPLAGCFTATSTLSDLQTTLSHSPPAQAKSGQSPSPLLPPTGPYLPSTSSTRTHHISFTGRTAVLTTYQARTSDVSSTDLARTADVLPTYRARTSDVSSAYRAQTSDVFYTYPVQTSDIPFMTGQHPAVIPATYGSDTEHVPITYGSHTARISAATLVDAASTPEDSSTRASATPPITPACTSGADVATRKTTLKLQLCSKAGCTPLRGVFQCEFAARMGKDDDNERGKLTGDREINHSVKPWKMLCYGERRCRWSIRYRLDVVRKFYRLTLVEAQHDGHRFRRSEPGGERVLEYGDLTSAMKESIPVWLRMKGSNTAMIRQVTLHAPHCPHTDHILLTYQLRTSHVPVTLFCRTAHTFYMCFCHTADVPLT